MRCRTYDKGRKVNFFLSFSIIFFLCMVTISFLREDSVTKIWNLENQLAKLEVTVAAIKRENWRLDTEVKSFNNGNYFVDKVAREELGLVKPGEIVYKFISESKE